MTVLSKYVVICDCTLEERIIAWIDDDRATGAPVRIDSDSNLAIELRLPNRRGGSVSYSFGCKACRKQIPPLSESKAARVIDKIIPVQATSFAVKPVPNPDRGATERRQQILPPDRRSPKDGAPFENRYVIPLAWLCRVVGELWRDN